MALGRSVESFKQASCEYEALFSRKEGISNSSQQHNTRVLSLINSHHVPIHFLLQPPAQTQKHHAFRSPPQETVLNVNIHEGSDPVS